MTQQYTLRGLTQSISHNGRQLVMAFDPVDPAAGVPITVEFEGYFDLNVMGVLFQPGRQMSVTFQDPPQTGG